jgi:hypothetical protein
LVVAPLPFAAINAGPDVDAFIGGVSLGLAAVLLVLALWGGLLVVRRILGA